MASRAQLKAQAKYDKSNTCQVILKLNVNSDADILAKLGMERNKQGYIKKLVRNDLRKTENEVLSLESIRCLLLPVVRKYEIRSLCIFGSYARNEAKPASDVDILIDGGNYHGLIEYMNMIDAMKTALGKEVDVITQTALEENNTEADIIFRKNIEMDKVVLV